ncbi:sigma-70 family RNA polymerase sigma factor [Bacteroides sp. GM023]|uniref:sigma-70 family RNA polymerase sigma factor n=1 Tax=Bacteroides sp. GM023 TaxID=2723058 RepID=UPI00168B1B8F|nr:sigma-70 family RNA polymerase sigma factor [Bacteroides sp. GM023]MBD3589955.1 sigma-70 family RNA polymerase sigma factor [Bacteroides sp. GM023]
MNSTTTLENFFSECYLEYRSVILKYISYRIPYSDEAEDLAQDVFVRLWEHRAFINHDTVRSLLFTIARNIIIDRIRNYYRKEEFTSYYTYNIKGVKLNTTEEQVQVQELNMLHSQVVTTLPSKRRKIYELSFCHELTAPNIAERLGLSIRTVEGQLLTARKSIRAFIKREYSEVV